jgi:nucleoside-diphosphate-sugar epimerase
MTQHPASIRDTDQLDDLLSEPTPQVLDAFRTVSGDLMILGVGGKMGPTLARMAQRAAGDESRRIIGVSRFSDTGLRRKLDTWGIETIACDLLDESDVGNLPDAPNVVCMTGMKFGAGGQQPLTWAMNTYLPTVVCRRYPESRIMAFSTGNVYPLVPVESGGSVESDEPQPIGEYAMSTLGRERMYEYFSQRNGTPISIVRLNYACELRYGVLVDLARQVYDGKTVDVSMGHVNVIWQGDANAQALCSLVDSASPAFVVNVAGSDVLRIRDVCERFGELLGKSVQFTGTEASDALLNNGTMARSRYGEQQVSSDQLIRWIADWIERGGESLGKPTHFETRDGKF